MTPPPPQAVELFPGPWWSTGVLNPDVHLHLVAMRDQIAQRSGLRGMISHLWTPFPESRSGERAWLRAVIQHPGNQEPVILSGVQSAIMTAMAEYTGVLLRNFVDARVLAVREIVASELDGTRVSAGVLMVPDFAVAGESPRHETAKRALVDCVRARLMRREATVLGVTGPVGATLAALYGPAVANDLHSAMTLSVSANR